MVDVGNRVTLAFGDSSFPLIDSDSDPVWADAKENRSSSDLMVPLFDINCGTVSRDLELIARVAAGGYPNVYGARVPVQSSWNISWMKRELSDYHDQKVLEFLQFGWPANRMPSALDPTLCTGNYASAIKYPQHINHYIEKELRHNAVLGPFTSIPFSSRVGVSPLSTRPKRATAERRTILDLSWPHGYSVNDYTPKDSYLGHPVSLRYPSIDDLARRMVELGPDCVMFKRDTSRCFRWLPLDPFDYSLFGYKWNDQYFFDKVLAMGRRISPYICQRVTNAIAYIYRKSEFFVLNYVDDFVGAEKRQIVHKAYCHLGTVMSEAGPKENVDKAVAPSPIIEFLGVTFNAIEGMMEVSPDRIDELKILLASWLDRRVCSLHDLQSLVGKLQFVAACIRPGRVFISQLLNTLQRHHGNRGKIVKKKLKKDVHWWLVFLPQYNGVSVTWMRQFYCPNKVLSADASERAVGGYWTSKQYWYTRTPTCWREVNIAYMELWAIIISLRVWGPCISGCRIVMKCDNESVVNVLNFGRARDMFLQAGLREAAFLQATYRFELRVVHLTSQQNEVSDWLSRWWSSTARKAFREFSGEKSLRRVKLHTQTFKFTHNW